MCQWLGAAHTAGMSLCVLCASLTSPKRPAGQLATAFHVGMLLESAADQKCCRKMCGCVQMNAKLDGTNSRILAGDATNPCKLLPVVRGLSHMALHSFRLASRPSSICLPSCRLSTAYSPLPVNSCPHAQSSLPSTTTSTSTSCKHAGHFSCELT